MNLSLVNVFLFITCNYHLITSAIKCMNENNEEVDWFAAYKIPKIKHEDKLIENGVGYVYVTSTNYNQWSFSKYSINTSDSMLGNTLAPFYQQNISYVIYNDQPPTEPSKSTKGHTKGLILANLEGGIWLIHSVPHFPPLSLNYSFSKSGTLKGQSFLCISLDLKNLNKVGIQLQYNQPQIYASYINKLLETQVVEIVKAVNGVVVTQRPWYNKIRVISEKGVRFTSFAKSKEFQRDLYKDLVAPTLQSDLFVETWLNGPGRLPSNCSRPFKVYNIERVKIQVANVSFSDTQDHSKWAVTTNSSWICIGDINRMNHQKFRGGGTMCLHDEKLAQNYRTSVVSIENCN